MPKKRVFLIIVVIVVAIPIAVDWLIIGNNFPSNISNSEWISFLGGYIGGIVGALVALIGIFETIRFTKEQLEMSKSQYEEQKRLNYIPVLDCKIYELKKEADREALEMSAEYTINTKNNLYPVTVFMDICNIGIGAALELKYGIELEKVLQDGIFWEPQCSTIRSQEILKQKLVFYIPKNERFDLALIIFYKDVIGNCYKKHIEFSTFYQVESNQLHCYILKQDNGELYTKEDEKEMYMVCIPK